MFDDLSPSIEDRMALDGEANPSPPPVIDYSRFDVKAHVQKKPLLAWSDRVGHIIGVLASAADLEKPFRASIDRYGVGELVFTDCRSDTILLERSLARISTDNIRDYVFQVFTEGGVDDVSVHGSPRGRTSRASGGSGIASILALDMGQPVRMRRHASRLLSFFVPGNIVAEVFPDPEAIHGRVVHNETPLAALIFDHVAALAREIGSMDASAAQDAIRTSGRLLAAVFGQQSGLSGNARAAARAAMFGRVRRYIQANLRDESLSPESVVSALQLSRPTVYRLFQHEGGLAAYIRHQRLRQAADELAHCPHLTITEIAYGLGFTSSSDFTRAFRRAYDMAPQDYRALARQNGA